MKKQNDIKEKKFESTLLLMKARDAYIIGRDVPVPENLPIHAKNILFKLNAQKEEMRQRAKELYE